MTDLPAGFKVEQVTVYRLTLNGRTIVDHHGTPMNYATEDEARFVAATWDLHRAPTYAELEAMTDDEIRRRANGLP